jgi:hypothetical protein
VALGIVGLASLFSSCLDAVRRLESWKDFGTEWKSVAAQFEAEKILFERWGQAVGLQLQSSQLEQHHHAALDNPRTHTAVTQLLYLVEDLCGSLGELHLDDRPQDTKWKRLKWALGRGEKSTAQVDQFSLLVRKLHALVPLDDEPVAIRGGLVLNGMYCPRIVLAINNLTSVF